MTKESLGLFVSLPLVIANLAIAQTAQQPDPTGDGLLLIQSELSHLEGGDQRINLQVKDASPSYTLDQIEKAVRFTIEVKGKLPRMPKLTGVFKETPAMEVLRWFAKEVDVVYWAERRGKLLVFPRPVADLK